MSNKFLIPLIIFIAITILLGIGLTMNPRAIPSTLIAKPAPNFTLPLLHDQATTFNPDQLKGQRWVLNVWASWCVSCRYEHPLLNTMANNGATIIGLNYKDKADAAKQWLNERGNPYTHSPFDESGRVGIEWGVIAVPETFVIDENGVIVYKYTGPLTADVIQQELMPVLTYTEASQ
ncbi:cytochrome C-type biogenesis protein [Arenicella chitinivorans]|uniref:Cytochrome C-type biogenesis protein n=1 Tax=Arenicella chitinivorans TaxID=1329800 RepID=A0A918VK04_9GAMM|nr:DsbE family thiol:disulfide interchange protein [Arenicella chitinivorans]GHA02344.1 cytochrome C-type biogenesis protein [Arenicella chitinivorans]